MNVNPTGPQRPLQTPVDEVASVLGLDLTADRELRRKIDRFIQVNGAAGVLRAAEYTSKRLDRVRDPWAFTVDVFNSNLARLSFLYAFVHWVEIGLRSRVGTALRNAHGDTWFEDPSCYLPQKDHYAFSVDRAQPTVWRRDHAKQQMVPNYADGTTFLESVTFGWLGTVAVFIFDQHLVDVLVKLDGSRLDRDELSKLVRDCSDARRLVAHNGYISDNGFREQQMSGRRLMDVLGFDLEKCLNKFENARRRVVEVYMKNINDPRLAGRAQPAAKSQ